MFFKLHFLFSCCVVTSSFCVGCMVRVTPLTVGVPRLLAPPCVTPGNGEESTAAAWRTALPTLGTWVPMQTSHLLCHSAFCLKILARTTQLHRTPGRDVKRNQYFHSNHENGVTERSNDSTKHTTFGVKPDSIYLDSSFKVLLQSAFCHRTDWMSQEDL